MTSRKLLLQSSIFTVLAIAKLTSCEQNLRGSLSFSCEQIRVANFQNLDGRGIVAAIVVAIVAAIVDVWWYTGALSNLSNMHWRLLIYNM